MPWWHFLIFIVLIYIFSLPVSFANCNKCWNHEHDCDPSHPPPIYGGLSCSCITTAHPAGCILKSCDFIKDDSPCDCTSSIGSNKNRTNCFKYRCTGTSQTCESCTDFPPDCTNKSYGNPPVLGGPACSCVNTIVPGGCTMKSCSASGIGENTPCVFSASTNVGVPYGTTCSGNFNPGQNGTAVQKSNAVKNDTGIDVKISNNTVVTTGLEARREVLQFVWKIQDYPIIQRDKALVDKQKFEFDMGEDPNRSSKWLVGLFHNSSTKLTSFYFKMVDVKACCLFSETQIFVEMKKVDGSTQFINRVSGTLKPSQELSSSLGLGFGSRDSALVNWCSVSNNYSLVLHVRMELWHIDRMIRPTV